jgi:hypothetical protein
MYNIYSGKIFLMLGDDVIKVERYDDEKKLKKGVGYLYNGNVLVYHGKLEKFSSQLHCGIYMDGNREHVIVEPSTKQERDMYSSKNIVDFNIDSIYSEIHNNKEEFLNDRDIEIINANAEVFTAVIKQNDDFLKKSIKEALNRKKINLKIYRDRFKNEHSLNNMKSALNKKSKMSVGYFLDWCEILGLDWTIIVRDSGEDPISNIGDAIIFSSTDSIV